METAPLTPMMAQWHSCKTQAKDALVLFRLGDFYEAFYEDAKLISQELGLTLTQRSQVPMCGVPFHAADMHIDKLIAKGHKVAIVEQTEVPKDAKGLVKREIVRVLTPGTVINSQLLQDKKNRYIASISWLGSVFGLALLDLTTGDFRALEFDSEAELFDELAKLRPAEMLAPKKFKQTRPCFFQDLSQMFPFLVNERDDWQWNLESALNLLLSHFRVQTLDGFGLNSRSAAIVAAGCLLSYLKEDLSLNLDHVVSIQSDLLSEYMALDRSTMRNLELIDPLSDHSAHHTLLHLLDDTSTAMGGRLLKEWIRRPLLNLERIRERQESIEDLLGRFDVVRRLKESLQRVRDLERLIAKISARYASPRDVWSLGFSLTHLPDIRRELEAFFSPLIKSRTSHLQDVSALADLILSSLNENPPLRITEGELFRTGVNSELDALRKLSQDSMGWLASYQTDLREKTGIKTLKVGYTRAFGYYIEVSRSKGEQVPENFQRRQTLVNAERFITSELQKFEHQVLTAGERAKALEAQMFEELRQKCAASASIITAIAKALAELDALLSIASAAKQFRWTKPLVDRTGTLSIQNGRHPIVEREIGASQFIPNDANLDLESRRLILLTGPNMAGKSTYIRQVALICILAQIGSYVPADSAHIGLVDKVFSRIGASDDLARGQSTFMVEMSETANILNNATSQSLVILDEIGRGTSTYDGISIAWAVAEFLLTAPGKMAKTLFATHYWELTRLETQQPGAINMHAAVEETSKGIVFLRKIVAGGTDRSYGIHVGKLAGLPYRVIKRAEELLASFEKNKQSAPAKKQRADDQPSLFSHPVVEELRRLDPNLISPMQALQILTDLRNHVISK